MHELNWDDIRYFLAVIEAGSVTAAAAELGVNHSTVSRRVSAFEAVLGTRLFDREPTGWAITSGGEDLLRSANEMAESVRILRRKVEGADKSLSGLIRITAPTLCFQHLIGSPLKAFSRKYPDIQVQLFATNEVLDLAYGDSDIALRITDDPPPNLVADRLATVAFEIYGSDELRQQLREDKHAVPAVTWIGDGKSIPPWISNNSANIQVKYRVSNVETMLEVARQGIGIAQLPCVVGDTEPNVRRIPDMVAQSGSGLWILSHVDLRLTARVRIFRDFMRNAFEPLVPLIEGDRPMSGTS